jgi:predicted Rossmann fold nucleotide-binding protein DprA/Smf involved in DNA uptake
LSHYGIARALPNLQPWRQAIREGRFLLLSHAQPEAPWEPGREELGCAVVAGLADRLVLVQGGRPATADRCARLALGLGRPVFIRPRDEATAAPLLAEGARVLSEPLGTDLLAALPARRGAAAAEPTVPSSVLSEEGTSADGLDEMVLRYLTGKRRPAGKGALLHALSIEEGLLDRALMRLMARGDIAQRTHRTGVAYTATGVKGAGAGAFQLSIFGLDQET